MAADKGLVEIRHTLKLVVCEGLIILEMLALIGVPLPKTMCIRQTSKIAVAEYRQMYNI